MKRWLIGGILSLWPIVGFAQQAGPLIVTHADVTALTCSGAATQVLAAATVPTNAAIPNRRCAFLTNSNASIPARCGDANVSTNQGNYLAAAGGSATYCAVNALYCCGVGGSATINPTESTNQ